MSLTRKLGFLVAAAIVLGLGPAASKLGPVLGPAASVALVILLSCTASGTVCAFAVTAGAVGAFAAGVLEGTSTAIAGTCLVLFAFAERTTRVRTSAARAVHLSVAAVGGALAGALSSAYGSSSPPVLGVSVLVGSVLMALPLLVEADDPIAHSLERTAMHVRHPASQSLREGAALRRLGDDTVLDPEVRRRGERTWKKLLKLAEARLRLERIRGAASRAKPSSETTNTSAAEVVLGMLDQAIADHVAALARAYTAVDTARAATIGLDNTAARGVDALGETLEDVTRALVDLKA
jgi:hypothetical protein